MAGLDQLKTKTTENLVRSDFSPAMKMLNKNDIPTLNTQVNALSDTEKTNINNLTTNFLKTSLDVNTVADITNAFKESYADQRTATEKKIVGLCALYDVINNQGDGNFKTTKERSDLATAVLGETQKATTKEAAMNIGGLEVTEAEAVKKTELQAKVNGKIAKLPDGKTDVTFGTTEHIVTTTSKDTNPVVTNYVEKDGNYYKITEGTDISKTITLELDKKLTGEVKDANDQIAENLKKTEKTPQTIDAIGLASLKGKITPETPEFNGRYKGQDVTFVNNTFADGEKVFVAKTTGNKITIHLSELEKYAKEAIDFDGMVTLDQIMQIVMANETQNLKDTSEYKSDIAALSKEKELFTDNTHFPETRVLLKNAIKNYDPTATSTDANGDYMRSYAMMVKAYNDIMESDITAKDESIDLTIKNITAEQLTAIRQKFIELGTSTSYKAPETSRNSASNTVNTYKDGKLISTTLTENDKTTKEEICNEPSLNTPPITFDKKVTTTPTGGVATEKYTSTDITNKDYYRETSRDTGIEVNPSGTFTLAKEGGTRVQKAIVLHDVALSNGKKVLEAHYGLTNDGKQDLNKITFAKYRVEGLKDLDGNAITKQVTVEGSTMNATSYDIDRNKEPMMTIAGIPDIKIPNYPQFKNGKDATLTDGNITAILKTENLASAIELIKVGYLKLSDISSYIQNANNDKRANAIDLTAFGYKNFPAQNKDPSIAISLLTPKLNDLSQEEFTALGPKLYQLDPKIIAGLLNKEQDKGLDNEDQPQLLTAIYDQITKDPLVVNKLTGFEEKIGKPKTTESKDRTPLYSDNALKFIKEKEKALEAANKLDA